MSCNVIQCDGVKWINTMQCTKEQKCHQIYCILWQLPPLAQPGAANDAIHCALLSRLISSSNLIATTLLPAASLAAGVIKLTLAIMHIAWALTAVVDINLRYCPTIMPSIRSDS